MAESIPQYRCYKPNKNGNGCASAWQLSFKPNNKYDQWMFFLVVAPQEGVDDKGNAKFDWKEKAITVKLGDNDLGEIIACLEGRQDQVGYKGSLYHQIPGKGNKILAINRNENGGFYLKVSAQDADKKPAGSYSHLITNGEAAMLTTLLKAAVVKLYNWA